MKYLSTGDTVSVELHPDDEHARRVRQRLIVEAEFGRSCDGALIAQPLEQ